MQINIPQDIEPKLVSEALRLGTTPEAIAIEALREKLTNNGNGGGGQGVTDNEHAASPPQNLAEFLGDFIGAVSSKDRFPQGSTLSRDTGRKFTEALIKEQRRQSP